MNERLQDFRCPRYRAWHIKKQAMHRVTELILPPETGMLLIGIDDGNTARYGSGEVVLMESAYINDQKGVEVFKGDVLFGLKYGKNSLQVVDHGDFFEGDGFICSGFYFDFDTVSTEHTIKAEVIGNIYQVIYLVDALSERLRS